MAGVPGGSAPWSRPHQDKARGWAGALLLLVLLSLPSVAQAAPSACPEHHPGGQAPDILRPSLAAETRELCFEAYSVVHSGVSRTPLAAAEHLTRRRIQQARGMERDDAFHAEDGLPEDERARLSDYARSGFDRGHMAPSGDMPTASAQADSFSLANMVPQNPGSNRCLWEGIESTVRDLAMEEGEVWVLTGPIFEGTTLQRLNGRVLVPTLLYKAIYLPGRGEAAAYLAPNAPGLAWRAVSLDGLREVAGLDAFPALPAAVKARAMTLPDPRPSNIAGSCANQPEGTRPPAPPAPSSPPGPVAQLAPSGSRIGLILAGVFALVMVVALIRVLGRR
ncbi:DNA/RNA non-specific endonuclease [Pararoseomonas indoligenes]|uniref:Endonuclease n=1 Tax=Roseomonas indoligenes TaxID=2820811 RepID=A0A940S7S4_9PROT|nr:DNA/RNA non-specific endonuclease [Pararoseomonas indoligenes]MBP0495220.1 DNA/RNA non-specific endonuclease [Pararoseomonas indoligenes]